MKKYLLLVLAVCFVCFEISAEEVSTSTEKPNAIIQGSSYVVEIVVGGLIWLFSMLWAFVKGKNKGDVAKDQATFALEAGVESAWTEFGKKWKDASQDGKLTDEEKKKLREYAYNKAVELSKGPAKDLLLLWGKDMAAALIHKIVNKRKQDAISIEEIKEEKKE